MAHKKDKSLENPARNKAKELVDQFAALNFQNAIDTDDEHGMSYEYHKKCAILLVDAQIETCNKFYKKLSTYPAEVTNDGGWFIYGHELESLQEIRAELIKLEE